MVKLIPGGGPPPKSGPNPQGLIKVEKKDKNKQENLNGRNR